jgi:hypothetical protein
MRVQARTREPTCAPYARAPRAYARKGSRVCVHVSSLIRACARHGAATSLRTRAGAASCGAAQSALISTCVRAGSPPSSGSRSKVNARARRETHPHLRALRAAATPSTRSRAAAEPRWDVRLQACTREPARAPRAHARKGSYVRVSSHIRARRRTENPLALFSLGTRIRRPSL